KGIREKGWSRCAARGPGANDLAGWVPAGAGVAGGGARLSPYDGDLESWVVAGRGAATGCIYVCLWARGALSRVDFVDWRGRWCGSLSSAHSIYISTQ